MAINVGIVYISNFLFHQMLNDIIINRPQIQDGSHCWNSLHFNFSACTEVEVPEFHQMLM